MAARTTSRSRPRRRLAAVAFALAALIVLVAPAAADPPVVSGSLPDITNVEATSSSGAAVSYDVSTDVSDADGSTPGISCSPGSGSTFPLGTTPVSCTFTNPNDSTTSTGGFNVTVQDSTPPSISGTPSNITVEGGSSGAVVTYPTPTASDAVDGSDQVNCAPASGTTFGVGTTTVNCSTADAHGNSAQTSFSVTVADTPPTIATPSNITTQATGSGGATVSYALPNASAAGGGSLVPTCQPGSNSLFAITTTTVTCKATDSYGNSSQSTFSVTVQDTTAPVINGTPANITAQGGSTGVGVTYANPTATDLVDGTDPVGCTPTSGSTFPVGTTTVNCTASDAHGNSAHSSFTVTVQATPPVIAGTPANMTVQGGPSGAKVTYASPTATAAGGGSVPVVCSPASGTTFLVTTTTVTCTATDTHNNTAQTSFTVLVQATAPTITGTPASFTAEATSSAGATVMYTPPTATAVGGASAPVVCAPASPAALPIAITTVTCTATDANGNTAVKTFTVTVQDTTPPVLTVPQPMTVSAIGPSGAPVAYAVSATDAVSGPIPTIPCSMASGATFPLGLTTVTCTATDGTGHKATGTFTVNVVDTLAPLLNVPGTVAVQATSASGAAVPFTVTALDAVDGAVTPSCSPASGATFPLGKTTVTCTAKDKAGNTASESFFVSVTTAPPPPPGPDHTPPALNVPAPFTAFAQGPKGAAVVFSTSAVDVADGSVPVTCAPASGSVFLVGATTVRCSAQDSHGNMATKSFTVLVVDKTPPPAVVGLTVQAKSGDTELSWQTPSSPDIDHIEVVRTKLPNGTPLVLFKGHASSFTDTHALNGVRYRYTVYSVDSIGNRAGLEVIVEPAPVVLVKPADGAKLTKAPDLLWVPAAKADYYNLQLYRNGTKVLSIWPSTNHYLLAGTWKFEGKTLKLAPGSYRWYVWPGLGKASSRTFGTLLGTSTFVVTK